MGIDDKGSLHTYVDVAYAVHVDMRSQTGGVLSLGHGTFGQKSIKQKLNTKSSTEAEVVGVADILPYNIWLRNFLESQGYILTENILYQDNQSAIKMEKNGRRSCTGNSRHISVRYFFVKDRVDKKEVSIKYCPSNYMLADYFTKPVQGKLFRCLRAVIMGHKPISWLETVIEPTKERVKRKTNLNGKIVVDSNCGKEIKNGVGKSIKNAALL